MWCETDEALIIPVGARNDERRLTSHEQWVPRQMRQHAHPVWIGEHALPIIAPGGASRAHNTASEVKFHNAVGRVTDTSQRVARLVDSLQRHGHAALAWPRAQHADAARDAIHSDCPEQPRVVRPRSQLYDGDRTAVGVAHGDSYASAWGLGADIRLTVEIMKRDEGGRLPK